MKQWVLVTLLLCAISSITTKAIPVIEIMEESLCPDCYNFIIDSFNHYVRFPIPNLAVVNLIPFGNAKEEFKDGKWIFECQHKENECYGNLMETCMIHVMGRVNSYIPIICINSNIFIFEKNFDKALDVCVLDIEVYSQIKDCVKSSLGNKLQHEMALKTPKEHNYVPWVTVDGVHDVVAEQKILTNMVEYLCSLPQNDCKDKDYYTKSPSYALHFLSDSKCYASEY